MEEIMKLRKFVMLLIVVALFFTLLVPACKNAQVPQELTVYVWEGYLPDSVADMFEQETGITLNINLITGNDEMFTFLKGGGRADIIMPTQNQVNRFYAEGLAQPLDLDKIPNYANITESFKEQDWSMWDGDQLGSGDTYVIAYIFGTSGIVVNTDKYTGSLEGIGWEILFDPALKERVSSKNSAESLMICLDLMGIPRANLLTDTRGTLESIRDKVVELKNNVLKFYDTGEEVLDLLSNEEIWESNLTATVGGSIDRAEGINKDLYVYTDEELARLVWQLNFPEEVVVAYNDFWEELSTIN